MNVTRRILILFLVVSSLSPCWAESTFSVDFSDYTPRNAAIRSALMPGWGQWFNGQDEKGVIMGGATLIATGVAIWLFIDSNDVYNQYTARGNPNDTIYDIYKREHNEAVIAASAAGAGYVACILDAYFTARRRAGKVSRLEYFHFAMDTTGRPKVSYDVPF